MLVDGALESVKLAVNEPEAVVVAVGSKATKSSGVEFATVDFRARVPWGTGPAALNAVGIELGTVDDSVTLPLKGVVSVGRVRLGVTPLTALKLCG